MTSKFSLQHQNILQPKRLNSPDTGRIEKGGPQQRPMSLGQGLGQTLTLNGVSIGVPTALNGLTSIVSNAPAKKGSNTMAKRNARERNRVKQVNLGFHCLRQHIPDGYRMKKMSKVDTLRCAVEYIRSMERTLEISPSSSMDIGNATSASYQSYSSSDINQHLDKIISMEETSNISLDQNFSSFSTSENEESGGQDCSSSSENHLSLNDPLSESHHHLSVSSDQEQCEPGSTNAMTLVSCSNGNNNNNNRGSRPYPSHLVGTTAGLSPSTTNPSNATSILVPLQYHSHSLNESIDIVPGDENFNPPSSSFIRVVEIITIQP